MKYPIKISLIYFFFSFIWIFFSDKILLLLTMDTETLTSIQTLKGIGFITLTSIFLYLLINAGMKKLEDIAKEKEKIINSLPSPIILFDENGTILLINKILEELTGYGHKDIKTIDEWIKKACIDTDETTKQKLKECYHIEKIVDNGIFNIKTINGENLVWHFNSAPFGIINEKRVIIASALDITQIQNKEKMLIQQSKMAAMGEILENIAHQWRQPLSTISTISTAATGVKMQNEFGTLRDDFLIESMDLINNSSQYLSKTIEDFRSFFKPNQPKESFKLQFAFEKSLMIINTKFKEKEIEFVNNIEDIKITNYSNALIQVLINIFNNSKDAFEEKEIDEKLIFVNAYSYEFNIIIEICDNAGGIPLNILDKVFEPYFTTKDSKNGTGIGLYMSEEITTKHMKGSIKVENKSFSYNDKNYNGAMFSITLPQNI